MKEPFWLPRAGDRVVLLSPGGRALTTWRITGCQPRPGTRLEAFTLTVEQDDGRDASAVTATLDMRPGHGP